MNDFMAKIRIDLHRNAARQFAECKGRMPSDKYELQSWLMEFTEELGKLVERWQDAVMEAEGLKVRAWQRHGEELSGMSFVRNL